LRLPDVADWPELERLGFEAEAIGFHLTAHPLDAYRQVLRRLGVVGTKDLEARAQTGGRLKLAGTIVNVKIRPTRTGSKMAWVRVSDASGSCEVTVFSEVLVRARDLLRDGTNVLITLDAQMQGETARLTAQDVVALDQAAAEAGTGIRVWLEETAAVPHISALLGREGSGKGRVVLIPRVADTQNVEIALPGGFNVTPRLTQALMAVAGVERVEEV